LGCGPEPPNTCVAARLVRRCLSAHSIRSKWRCWWRSEGAHSPMWPSRSAGPALLCGPARFSALGAAAMPSTSPLLRGCKPPPAAAATTRRTRRTGYRALPPVRWFCGHGGSSHPNGPGVLASAAHVPACPQLAGTPLRSITSWISFVTEPPDPAVLSARLLCSSSPGSLSPPLFLLYQRNVTRRP